MCEASGKTSSTRPGAWRGAHTRRHREHPRSVDVDVDVANPPPNHGDKASHFPSSGPVTFALLHILQLQHHGHKTDLCWETIVVRNHPAHTQVLRTSARSGNVSSSTEADGKSEPPWVTRATWLWAVSAEATEGPTFLEVAQQQLTGALARRPRGKARGRGCCRTAQGRQVPPPCGTRRNRCAQ